MDDVKRMLQDVLEEYQSGTLEIALPPKRTPRRTWLLPVEVAVVAGGILVAMFALHSPAPPLQAVPCTTYPGWEADPSFSPEGTRVVFSWNGRKGDNWDIYAKLIGEGDPQRLTSDIADDFSPAWSPDGRTIAFLRWRADKLELLSVPAMGGAPEKKLGELNVATTYRGYPNRELAWSPDSSSLVFFDKPPDEPPGLFLMSLATRGRVRLTTCPATLTRDSDPSFSPDGKTLAFTRIFTYSFSHLYLQPLSDDLRPVGQPRRIAQQARNIIQPDWTPDGRDLVFSNKGTLWRIPASGSSAPEHLPFTGEQLDISRVGHRMVFNAPTWDSNIWRVELDQQKQVAPPASFIASSKADTNPQYSPDGQKVAFASDRGGNFEIWICNADGLKEVQLTSLGADESGSPRWFPDGRQVVFDSDKEGNFDIYVINVDGGVARRLTEDPAGDVTPTVSRDGKTIYFSSRRTGTWEIWRIPSGRGTATQVTKHGGFSPFEGAAGDFLYYQKTEGRFSEVWRVPVHGGEETMVLRSVGDRRFAVLPDGIYYIEWSDSHSPASLQFFSFAAGNTKKISSIEGPFLFYDLGLTVSPDARSVLYTHPDHPNSDLMLVENFR
jgi:Tol biopolymer transport system component